MCHHFTLQHCFYVEAFRHPVSRLHGVMAPPTEYHLQRDHKLTLIERNGHGADGPQQMTQLLHSPLTINAVSEWKAD